MNHQNFNKLNDRKRRIHHEYEQGKDYFMETSMENVVNPNNLYNSSLYQAFIDTLAENKHDESIEEKNSPNN